MITVNETIEYNDQLSRYIRDLFVVEDEPLQSIRERTSQAGLPPHDINPEEGRFLQLLTRACSARKAIEFGTLAGYSSIWIAQGLMPGGKLFTFEKERLCVDIAKENFVKANVASQIEVLYGDAHTLVESLIPEAPFDFMFIDAEKTGYVHYFDWAVQNTRVGGFIVAHNAFLHQTILDLETSDEGVKAMQQFHQHVAAEPRVMATVFPAGDGTVIAVKIA